MVRHIFAGGNTPDGFFSYFDNILPLQESKKMIYMKGGSGTGKSTFMKKIGGVFQEKGYDIEYFHCSNDPDSLDSVCIPQLKIAVVDATAPHTQDPSIPVAVDEILNVAVCLDSKGLRAHAEELKTILAEKKGLIRMAYGYLKAAYAIYQNNSYIYESSINNGSLNVIMNQILEETLSGQQITEKIGKNRKLFATAITPIGFINYSEYLFTANNLTIFEGSEGCGADRILHKLQEEANTRGLNTEAFYSPLSPGRMEHLIIPDIEACFTTSNEYHKFENDSAKTVNLYDLCNSSILKRYKDRMDENRSLFDELAHKAMNSLKESNEIHNRVEEIYISNMNFDQLDEICDSAIEMLLEFE